METTFEVSEANIVSADEQGPKYETVEDHEAEDLAALVEDVYLIGQTCKDYYETDLRRKEKTVTFKRFVAENRDVVLKLKAQFPSGFHNTRIPIRGKQMTWAEFVQDCFGVTYSYIQKLLKQTEKHLLQAQVVELQTKVDELSEKLEAKAASEQRDAPVVINAPRSIDAGDGILPDDIEEATFPNVVRYFESLDADARLRQLAILCEHLDITISTE